MLPGLPRHSKRVLSNADPEFIRPWGLCAGTVMTMPMDMALAPNADTIKFFIPNAGARLFMLEAP